MQVNAFLTHNRYQIIVISMLFLAVCLSSAGKLGINGEFEQPLTDGWSQTINGLNVTIDRATDYDPDPDYEAYVYKGTGGGYCRLYQVANIFDIPLNELDFSVNAKLYAYDNDPEAYTGAAVELIYLDENDSCLGATKICARSSQCPWSNTSNHHIIDAPNTQWNNYTFNISDELTNLPGIAPGDIKKIQISLIDSTYHC